MTLPNIEVLYESDCGDLGSAMSLIISGHVEDDMAVPLAAAEMIEYGYYETIDRPKRIYMRKVPLVAEDGYAGGWIAQYQTYPGRGASAVTLVDFSPRPYRPCALCPWDSTTGFPVDRFIDPPKADDRGLVWLCRAHATDFWDRLEAARKAALQKLRAAEAAS